MAYLHVDDDLGSSNNQGTFLGATLTIRKKSHLQPQIGWIGAPDLRGYPVITVDGQKLPVDSDFAYPDGNIELQTSSRRFWVHEFQLAKFAKVTELIRQARDRGEVTPDPERRIVICIQPIGKVRCIDFQNTFRVIYSSLLSAQAPSILDTETLVSTLRIATLFQNPGLRDFALSELESKRFYIAAIDRIALSDELKLPGWEIAAFDELCRRPESISPEEASVLGNARFAKIARIREAELRRQYMALVDEVAMDPFLKMDGTVMKDRLGAIAVQTLKYPSLPICDCQSRMPARVPPRVPPPPPSISTWITGSRMLLPLAAPPPPPSALPSSPPSGVVCQIHQLAPSIACESRSLYKYLSDLLERLGALKIAATARIHGLPGGDKGYSIEDELKGTS